MERHLSTHGWFNGNEYGIADIALFAYTDIAHHGGFDCHPRLAGASARNAWIRCNA